MESAYEECLSYELSNAHIHFDRQKPIGIKYKNVDIDCGYKIDLFVNEELIIELKAVEKILPIHEAQILTYMKLAKISLGLLINFNSRILTKGIKRFVL